MNNADQETMAALNRMFGRVGLIAARQEEYRLRHIVEEEMHHAIARGETVAPGELPTWNEYAAALAKLRELEAASETATANDKRDS